MSDVIYVEWGGCGDGGKESMVLWENVGGGCVVDGRVGCVDREWGGW